MSTEPRVSAKRLTVPALIAMKGQHPIVTLTAYTAPMAQRLDAHADILLVGDSLGMVVYGEDSTLGVTLGDMIRHGRAVVRASQRACVIIDMPFGSYQASTAQAFDACATVMKETGCAAVKLEGGAELAETVYFLTQRGIPVMSHIGLMPQRVHAMGGYRWQGRTDAEAERLLADARVMEQAGAFSLLLEGVDATLADQITQSVHIPTIGIGAGPGCDGQVLVTEDLLGLFPQTPKFVRRYAEIGTTIDEAVASYAQDVREGRFPTDAHSYSRQK
jgi:3-methyl-2-oxobutanoate hydroxymethyltransferase